MQKYFYIGLRQQQVVVEPTGRSRQKQVTRWNSTVYTSAEQAADACAKMMVKHLGLSFFIQGFERPLDIVDGVSKGMVAQ